MDDYERVDGRRDFTSFLTVFQSYQDDEIDQRLRAMEPCLRLGRFCLEGEGLDFGTARSVGQHLTH